MTTSTPAVKTSLWLSLLFNFIAAYLFAFPGTFLGQLIGLPATVPPLYLALTAYFIALFGVAYGWLAMQNEVVKPLLWLGALGKLGVFVLATILWLSGALSLILLLVASVDLAFALHWLAWLRTH